MLRSAAHLSLQRVHDCGVLHGDLRLANLVYSSASSGIKLVDFGRACVGAVSSDDMAHEIAELEELFISSN